MKIAIASFAKTIGLSLVKTRLAASIGRENAEAFFRLSVACVKEVLEEVSKQNPNVFPYWALADEKAVGLDEWQGFPNLWTGEGGLGTRLSSISNRLFVVHDAVFLIGTDSPQISPESLLQAFEVLETNPNIDHVTGSATDGGFWLWGSQKPLPVRLWESVPYSVETTLEELITATNARGDKVGVTTQMQDVDVVEDLISLQETLEQKGERALPSQVKLLNWLQEKRSTFQV